MQYAALKTTRNKTVTQVAEIAVVNPWNFVRWRHCNVAKFHIHLHWFISNNN